MASSYCCRGVADASGTRTDPHPLLRDATFLNRKSWLGAILYLII